MTTILREPASVIHFDCGLLMQLNNEFLKTCTNDSFSSPSSVSASVTYSSSAFSYLTGSLTNKKVRAPMSNPAPPTMERHALQPRLCISKMFKEHTPPPKNAAPVKKALAVPSLFDGKESCIIE
jgi:hypothetical protein